MFNQPQAHSGWFKPAEKFGHLILITRFHGTERKWDTLRNAEVDEAIVDLVDLDDSAPALVERLRISHAGIVNKIARDGMTLGRIGQATTRSGMNAYVLDAFTEGVDDVRAQQWLAANPVNTVRQPAPAAQAPAPTPAAATPAQAAQAAPAVDANDPRVMELLKQLGGTVQQ